MKELDSQQVQQWMKQNLVDKKGAAEITGQSMTGFNQSVNLGYIVPFFDNGKKGSSSIRLYLKSELEIYAKNKRA